MNQNPNEHRKTGVEYTCSICNGTFTEGWTDQDAIAEFKQVFKREPTSLELSRRVCDDCYKQAMNLMN